jgi:hypothetical protein
MKRKLIKGLRWLCVAAALVPLGFAWLCYKLYKWLGRFL